MSKNIVIIGGSTGIGKAIVEKAAQNAENNICAFSRQKELMSKNFKSLNNVSVHHLDLEHFSGPKFVTDIEKLGPIDILIMLLIETIIVLIGVVVTLAHRHSKNPYKIIEKLSQVSIKDYTVFILFAIYGMITSLVGLEFLKHHDVSQIRISDFIISIPIICEQFLLFTLHLNFIISFK